MSKPKKSVKKAKKLSKKTVKPSCALVCPKCGLYWARMRFQYGTVMKAADIDILVGGKKKFANGDELACVSCKHSYSNYDVMLAIAEPNTSLKPGSKVPMPADEPEVLDEDGAEVPPYQPDHYTKNGASYDLHPGGELIRSGDAEPEPSDASVEPS